MAMCCLAGNQEFKFDGKMIKHDFKSETPYQKKNSVEDL
jgi:hypothetical protein